MLVRAVSRPWHGTQPQSWCFSTKVPGWPLWNALTTEGGPHLSSGREVSDHSHETQTGLPPGASGPPLRPTLDRVVGGLGPAVVRVVAAPSGLDIEVRQAWIHDNSAPGEAEAGDLVLAVGVGPESDQALELTRRAGKVSAAAVLFRFEGEASAGLRRAADTEGVALLAAASEVTWSQLHRLVDTVISGADPAGGTPEERLPARDLFALANAISAMVGGPVTIEDRQSRLLAYSSQDEPVDEARRQTILGRRVPDWDLRRLEADGVFRQLWSAHGVIRHEPAAEFELAPRLVVAVRAGEEILGSIWVAERERPLGEEAVAALTEAARIAAFYLLRHRLTGDLDRYHRGEVLRSLLEGRAGSHGTDLATLGMDIKLPLTVLAFQPRGAEAAELDLKAQQVVDLIGLYGEAFRHSAACVALGNVVYVLLPDLPHGERARVLAWASGVVSQAREALNMDLACGVGSSIERFSEIARSRQEAEQALRVVGRIGARDGVGDIEALHSQVLMLRLEDMAAELPDLASGRVAFLQELDGKSGTEYLATLRAFLSTFGNVAEAARLVDVHENTFRYRIRRLTELAGIDLDDPDERLVLQLQLRLLER